MDSSIKNSSDLKAEIDRLRSLKTLQGEALKERFNGPSAIFHTFVSLFPHSADGKSSLFNQDFVGLISRILLPLTLNKTIFRNSNFLIKGLVGFISQKASHFISEDSITGLWAKVRSIFDKKDKDPDYGIPPLSEAS